MRKNLLWFGWSLLATVAALFWLVYFVRQSWWAAPYTVAYRVYRGGLIVGLGVGVAALWVWACPPCRRRWPRLARLGENWLLQPAWLRFWAVAAWLSTGAALLPPQPDFLGLPQWKYSLLWWRWLAVVAWAAWGMGLWAQRGRLPRLALPERRGAGWVLVGLGLTFGLLAVTGLGWKRALYWQGVGVPVTSGEVWLVLTVAAGVVILGRWVGRRFGRRLHATDGAVFLFLWALTFVVWMSTPPTPSYFQPPSFPPNEQHYLASDAAYFALGANQGRLGYGYFSSAAFPHGLPTVAHQGLAGLLALLHLVTTDFGRVTALWVLLLALTPPLLYLLAALGYSRGSGLLLAGLAIVREYNVIAYAHRFRVAAHVKIWLTEPLLREILVLLTLSALLFVQQPQRRKGWLWAAGALLGLAYLVRRESEVLIVLAVLLLAFEVLRQRVGGWRQGAVLVGVLLVGWLAVLEPWHARAVVEAQRLPFERYRNGSRLFWLSAVERALWPSFRPEVFALASPTPTTGTLASTPTAKPTVTRPAPTATPTAAATKASPTVVPTASTATPTAAATKASPTVAPTASTATPTAAATKASPTVAPSPTAVAAIATVAPTATPLPPSASLSAKLRHWHGQLLFNVLDLSVRNGLALLFAFPPDAEFYSVYDTLWRHRPLWGKSLDAPWRPFTPGMAVVWLFNVGLVALGVAALWRKMPAAVVAPVSTALVYLGATAVGRDAGGRYVLPFDWVLPLFYAVGWMVLLREGAKLTRWSWPQWWRSPWVPTSAANGRRGWWLGGGIVLLALAMLALEFGAMGWVAFSGQDGAAQWPGTAPPRWRPVTNEEFLTRLDQRHAWDDLPWPRAAVAQALKQGSVVAGWGYLFYPRYVAQPRLCGDLCRGFSLTQPTLFFDGLVGASRPLHFVLPGSPSPPRLADGTEMLVLYCPQTVVPHKTFSLHAYHRAVALITVRREHGLPVGHRVFLANPTDLQQCAAAAQARR